jgi:hypothetical protein
MTCIVTNIIPAHKIIAAIINGHGNGPGHSCHHHIIMIASNNHERDGKSE